MKYKNYTAIITYDDKENIFCGEVIGTKYILTFEGKSIEELEAVFKQSIESYLAWCASKNETPEKPYSGNIRLRLTPVLHEKLVRAAAKAKISLHSLIENRLEGFEDLENTENNGNIDLEL